MVQLPDISELQCFVPSCSQCWAILPLVIWSHPILSCVSIAECNSGASWSCILRISAICCSVVDSFSFCSIHWCSCLVIIFVNVWCVCQSLHHFVSLFSCSILKFLAWISVHWKMWFCVSFSFLHSGQSFFVFSCCYNCLQLLIMNSLFIVGLHLCIAFSVAILVFAVCPFPSDCSCAFQLMLLKALSVHLYLACMFGYLIFHHSKYQETQ